jgi:hypothetical protein
MKLSCAYDTCLTDVNSSMIATAKSRDNGGFTEWSNVLTKKMKVNISITKPIYTSTCHIVPLSSSYHHYPRCNADTPATVTS